MELEWKLFNKTPLELNEILHMIYLTKIIWYYKSHFM